MFIRRGIDFWKGWESRPWIWDLVVSDRLILIGRRQSTDGVNPGPDTENAVIQAQGHRKDLHG